MSITAAGPPDTYPQTTRGSARTGHWLASEAVQTATTVRVRNGQAAITDGPFAGTQEQLAGFYLIEAKDLNEALQVVSKIPPARVGNVEVWPIRQWAGASAPKRSKELKTGVDLRPHQATIQ